MLKQFRIYKSVIIGLVMFVITTDAFSQHPIYQPEKFNHINRIDSLTMALLQGGDYSGNDKINALEQQVTEELFYEKINLLGSALPYQYNAEVAQQIRYMTNPASKFMMKCLLNKEVYFPIFEEMLDKNTLPQDLKYLSVIESALNPNAVSWCGATGLWQFMPGTGRMYQLEISGEMDERKEIVKSTDKAIFFLNKLHDRYDDWFMALAAYNCGPGNVNKAIKRSGGKTTFWEIRRFLPKETQNYIPKFIAAVFVMNFVDLNALFTCEEKFCKIVSVDLDKPVNLKLASAILQWDDNFVSEYNAHYKSGYIPEMYADKKIYLPYYAAMQFLEMRDSIYIIHDKSVQSGVFSSTQKLVYHKVQKGQTIYKIATQYKVTADDVKRWNKLKGNTVYAGQSLRVYKTVVPEYDNDKFIDKPGYYIILEDFESIAEIKQKLPQIDVEETLKLNEMDSDTEPLAKGTLIKVIGKTES